ncbi:MAG: SPOR domain-containing protein [Pseudomonadota bacterium]
MPYRSRSLSGRPAGLSGPLHATDDRRARLAALPGPLLCALLCVLLLGGCLKEGALGEQASAGAEAAQAPEAAEPVDRALYGVSFDGPTRSLLVAAPELFERRTMVRWEGRKTLDGIWIAHPDATRPERVRLINTESWRAADGAMVRRGGGDTALISTEAAEALGIRPYRDTEIIVVGLDYAPADAPVVAAADGAEEALPDTIFAETAEGAEPVAVAAGAAATGAVALAATAGEAAAPEAGAEIAESAPEVAEAAVPQTELAAAELTGSAPAEPGPADPAPSARIAAARGGAAFEPAEIDIDEPIADAAFVAAQATVDAEAAAAAPAGPAPSESAPRRLAALTPEAAVPLEAPGEATPEVETARETETAPEPEPETAPKPVEESAEPSAPASDFALAPVGIAALSGRREEREPVAEAGAGAGPERVAAVAAETTVAPAPAAEAEPAPAPAETIRRRYIQAGIFSSEGNAGALVKALQLAGIEADPLEIQLSGRPALRVRAGPFESLEERRRALRLLRSRLGAPDAHPVAR